MINGVEFDFVVKDSKAALAQYKSIFDVEVVEETNFKAGNNEAVFTIYGTRFHMLDENPEYQLFAPKEGRHNLFGSILQFRTFKKHMKKRWLRMQQKYSLLQGWKKWASLMQCLLTAMGMYGCYMRFTAKYPLKNAWIF